MRGFVVAAALVLTSACCDGAMPASPGAVSYDLLTHCGIYYTRFDGHWYYADPPNPPGHWTNPIDQGTMTVIDQSTIVFTDPAGNRARFTTNPDYPTPAVVGCD